MVTDTGLGREAVLHRADDLRTGRTPYVLATVVRAEPPTSAKPGDRALVLPDGSLEGFVGGTCAEATVKLHGLRLLRTGESTLLRITPEAAEEVVGAGMVTVGNPCLSGGSLDIFLEAVLPPLLVHVVGEAPVARALVEVGRALGHAVLRPAPGTELPPDLFALVVASHGRDEEVALRAALRAGVPYVGLVASRRRGAAVLAALDVAEDQRARVHTPAGLDIGARTAPEIALSVYAELIAVRPAPRAATPPTSSAAPPATGSAASAGTPPAEAVDPVCGMTVAVTPDTPTTADGDRRVWFCGPGCRHAFTDNPDKYPT